jgi:hypothetical protein
LNSKDFYDWKRHPVTQIIFSQLDARIKDLQEILGDSAGLNPREDVVLVGAIKAYKDMINIEYEGEEPK